MTRDEKIQFLKNYEKGIINQPAFDPFNPLHPIGVKFDKNNLEHIRIAHISYDPLNPLHNLMYKLPEE
jgi:hypothetical protein